MSPFANIFEFTHFRKFLAEYQVRRALMDPQFTRTEFCKQLGLPNTRSYFNDVVQGKRVTKIMLGRFLKVLDLPDREARYFKAMVHFDQARSSLLRQEAFAEMQKIHPNPQSILEPDAFEYYSHWYHSAVFTILDVLNVNDDLTELESRINPTVSITNLQESIQLLHRLGLIRKDPQGYWKPTRDRLSTGNHSQEALVKQYQVQCMDLSKLALESSQDRSKDMTSMTFSVSDQASKNLLSELETFRNRIRKIVTEDAQPASQVLHLNMHLLSVLKKEEPQ